MTYRKVGGLHFWRIGRVGGSFYMVRSQRERTWPWEASVAVAVIVVAIVGVVL